MQSDLQALQAHHSDDISSQGNTNNNLSSSGLLGNANSSGQGQTQVSTPDIQAPTSYGINLASNKVPNEPKQSKQNQRKRTARSTSRASHNPRADNSSNWDTVPKKKMHKEVNPSIQRITSGHQDSPRNNFQYVKVVGGGIKRPDPIVPNSSPLDQVHVNSTTAKQTGMVPNKRTRTAASSSSSPPSGSDLTSLQDNLDILLSARGYKPKKEPASKLGYRQPPTPLQLASFGFAICSTIKPNGADRLTALLQSGLSPNPTNKFGDSPFFMACKRGLYPLVKVFVDNGADVRVADSFGRTPLHYVAWANPPCLQSAQLLLEADARLLYVTDAHSKTPLDFVGNGETHRKTWIKFLERVKDQFWPTVNGGSKEYSPMARDTSLGTGIPDPKDALSLQLAEKVASGHIMPEEAKRQQKQLAH